MKGENEVFSLNQKVKVHKVKVLIYAPVLTSIFTPKFRGMQQQNPPNKTFDQTKDETIN